MIHTILDLSEVLYPMETHKNIYNYSSIDGSEEFFSKKDKPLEYINIQFSTDPNSFIK
ncbi:MAG: hypothetical protein KFW09_02445 [Oscillospiraceae bacterium]|nr:hypothetical protein [Oscillospiraceae bacterium]